MRRAFAIVLSVMFVFAFVFDAVQAAPSDYAYAERDFETNYTVEQRLIAQVLLIAGGFTMGVPVEHFSGRTFEAIEAFQVENGFRATGLLDKLQIDRLFAVGGHKLADWGFQKITHPNRPVTIWVPLGLGLDVKETASGLHYKDRQGRLELDFVSVPGSALGVYNSLLEAKRREGAAIHFNIFKDREDWFVISATTRDGADHYYRYHQDGGAVTGFALEWNNATGNVNGERIAVILSGALRSAMTGAPYIDPPAISTNAEPAPVPAQTAAIPVAPAPRPAPKATISTGTGFFVTEEGHFVTNAHVVADCTAIRVKSDDGSVSEATRIATDSTNDLSLLKLDKKPARVVAIRIGGRLGEGIEAFGFPHSDLLSTSGNFTLGNITAMNGIGDDSRYLQISAPVQAGNSGGPLLDQTGNLLGVVSAKLDAIKVAMDGGDLPQNVNFAVKSTMVAAFLDANRVAYKVGVTGGAPMQPADIADLARAMSGFVMCK